MKMKTLLAVAVAGAFALPLAAQASADGDRMILAQAGGPAGASAVGTGPTGGTPSPRSAGEPSVKEGTSVSGSAAAGASAMDRTPSFSELDKNNDGQISRAEWDAHQGNRGAAAAGGVTSSPSTGVVSPGGSSTTGATAGPGSASNRTAPSSDTATSPSTSGQGKAK